VCVHIVLLIIFITSTHDLERNYFKWKVRFKRPNR